MKLSYIDYTAVGMIHCIVWAMVTGCSVSVCGLRLALKGQDLVAFVLGNYKMKYLNLQTN